MLFAVTDRSSSSPKPSTLVISPIPARGAALHRTVCGERWARGPVAKPPEAEQIRLAIAWKKTASHVLAVPCVAARDHLSPLSVAQTGRQPLDLPDFVK